MLQLGAAATATESYCRALGAAASRTKRARGEEGDALRALLGFSTSPLSKPEDEVSTVNSERLRAWLQSGRLQLGTGSNTTALLFTRSVLEVVDGDRLTLLSHNAAAGGNLSVLRVLLLPPADAGYAPFPPDARDAVR